jgi:hypothetical protein
MGGYPRDVALAEVFREAYVYCSCGESERLSDNKGKVLTGHQFLSDRPHVTEILYDMSVTIVSAPLWAASVSAANGPQGNLTWP